MKTAPLSCFTLEAWVVYCSLLALGGCATPGTVTEAEGEGERRTYPAGKEQAWEAMTVAVAATGGRPDESDEQDCRLVAGYPASAWSWGEWVALFCRPVEGGTEIEIVMQPNLRTNMFPKDRVTPLYEAIDAELRRP